MTLMACSTISYYNQSVMGHLNLMWEKQQIKERFHDPALTDKERKKLRYILDTRSYASRELKLPDNDSYTEIAYINTDYIVWNVNATPEFSLQAVNWCYLIIGCVSYRGYFNKNDAESFARTLDIKGLDTTVTGASAYSTLGWFDDPILSNMLAWKDRSISGLIFHELAHQVVYISDNTSFNEAFAKAVEQIGVLYWLASYDKSQLKKYFTYLERHHSYRLLLRKTKQSLVTLYNSDENDATKRAKKAQIFLVLRNEYQAFKKHWKTNAYDNWFSTELNNARFVSDSTYYSKLPIFFALFVENNGNWNKFYSSVKALGKLDNKQRNKKEITLAREQITLEIIYEKYIKNRL